MKTFILFSFLNKFNIFLNNSIIAFFKNITFVQMFLFLMNFKKHDLKINIFENLAKIVNY